MFCFKKILPSFESVILSDMSVLRMERFSNNNNNNNNGGPNIVGHDILALQCLCLSYLTTLLSETYIF